MADMLVNLLKLPEDDGAISKLKEDGILIRRVQPYEISHLRKFVASTFGILWANEVTNAFTHQPVTCFVATHEAKIVGFGAYECTRRDYFGPTGVQSDFRGKGIGKALLLVCLRSMYELGYVYAIIGGVGPSDFYKQCVGAVEIADSSPGIYIDRLAPLDS